VLFRGDSLRESIRGHREESMRCHDRHERESLRRHQEVMRHHDRAERESLRRHEESMRRLRAYAEEARAEREQRRREAEERRREAEQRRLEAERAGEERKREAEKAAEERRQESEARIEELREFNHEILLRNEKVYTRLIAEIEEGRRQIQANTKAVLSVLDRLEGRGGT
jgi:hypothetical protein